ncbi:MAG: winged helix-turn-helix domain-containing protein [Pseudohongiellaceae bacterium]
MTDSPSITGKIGDAEIQCRVRVTRGDDIAIGPGKMDVLAAIRDAGSISGAARRMGMSYRRAWLLVETMNSCFERPLVETATGGKSGGGARLTPEGERVLSRYTTMMVEVDAVAERHLLALLHDNPLAAG